MTDKQKRYVQERQSERKGKELKGREGKPYLTVI